MAAAASASASAAAAAAPVGAADSAEWEKHDRAAICFALSLAEHFHFEFNVLFLDGGHFVVQLSRADTSGKWVATAWLDPKNTKTPWVEYADTLNDENYEWVDFSTPDPTLLSSFTPPSFPAWCANGGQDDQRSPIVPLAQLVAHMFAHIRDTDKDVDLDAIDMALCALAVKSGEAATTVFTTGVMHMAKEWCGGDMDRFATEDGVYIYCDGLDIWDSWKVSKRTKDLVEFVTYWLKYAALRAKVTGDPSQFEAALVGKEKGKRRALDNGDDASAQDSADGPPLKRARAEAQLPLWCTGYGGQSVQFGIRGMFKTMRSMANDHVDFIIFTNGVAIGDGATYFTNIGLHAQRDTCAKGPVLFSNLTEPEASRLSDVHDGLKKMAVFVPMDKPGALKHLVSNHLLNVDALGTAFADVECVYVFKTAEGMWFFTSCDGPGVDDVRDRVTRSLSDHYSGSDDPVKCNMPFEIFDVSQDAETLRARIPQLSLVTKWALSTEEWYQKEYAE